MRQSGPSLATISITLLSGAGTAIASQGHMTYANDFGFLIFSLFIVLPLFLMFAWSWRWWRNGSTSQHPGHLNAAHPYPHGPHTGVPPKNYRRSDERILDEISDRLMMHGLIDASQIEVTCFRGVVNLEGTVESRRARRQVEEIVESVAGILDFTDHLHIDHQRRILAATPGLRTQPHARSKPQSAEQENNLFLNGH